MHITAVCPACENSFKVESSLRGKSLRCPNAECRTVFTVPAEEPPAPAKPLPPSNGRRTGSVGDLVPLVPAEAVEAPASKAAPSWQTPPPVRRPADPAAPSTPAPAVNDGPREMPPGTWEPPPVRRGRAAAPAETPVERPAEAAPIEPPVEAAAVDEPIPHPPARRVGLVVAAFALFVVAFLGGGGVYLWYIMQHSEGAMSQEAESAYKREQFSQSADLYKQLAEQFPTSDKHDSYVLMQGLSDLRNQASAPDPELSAALDKYFDFLQSHKEPEQALKERAPDLGATVVKLAEGYAERHRDSDDDQGLDNAATRLEKAFEAAKALAPDAVGPALQEPLRKATGALHARASLVKLTRECVGRIKDAAAVKPAARAVRNVMAQVKEEKGRLSDIDKNPEVVEIVKQVYANHIKGVTYDDNERNLAASHRGNDETTLVVNSPLRDAGSAPADDRVVLALVRGVLYGLEPTTGRTKWALRVGVDATALPVRVPATEISPERILVPSADALTLAALDADGNRLWEYKLSDKCIGRPLVIGNLAYVPTYDGKVHEIELAQGKLKGVYDLGQHLTSGGALQPGTNLLYFPADDFCVYVLDAKERRCVAVLYTGHPAGSLRGEPLVLTPDPEEGESWLVLNEARGLDHTQLCVYRLPIAADREQQAPVKRVPEPPLPGWTWFPPSHDGEMVAMLGDTGVLGLFGIRQARNLNDPPLFPMLSENFAVGPKAAAKDHGRSEVVEMRGQDFCLLANGRLHRYYLELNAAEGPKLEPAADWNAPPLGSPLHATQVRVRPDDGATLFLVTQPLTQQTCLATAVDDREGDVLWQRQLGLVCRGKPVELPSPGGAGATLLLTLDAGGGLFAFDPAKYAGLADGKWCEGGENLFPALDDGPAAPPVLLPGPDGQTAYEIASPGDGKKLVVRRVERTAGGLEKTEHTIPLTSPLAGTPAVTDSMLVLPLAKGVLARVTLPLAPTPTLEEGPNWRARRAPADAVGRVTALGDGTFVTWDGWRGLTHWQWSKAKDFTAFPAGKDENAPTLKLENSLTSDPVLLPEVKDSPRQLCIADAAGVVTLLTVAGDGGLKTGRSWNLGGRITAGPYVQTLPGGETRIGCIVDEKQLVWLDPDADKPEWTYPTKRGAAALPILGASTVGLMASPLGLGPYLAASTLSPGADAALVGRPRLVGGLVVVADESGLIVGLDPTTGKAGPEYRLHGSTAPALSPVGFGADRLFVPLSDGTILLPPVGRIR